MKSFSGEQLALEEKDRTNASFTLVELLIVTGLLSLIALLVYPAYLGTSRSYSLSDVKSSLQQNGRLAMKSMVTYLEGGMIVIPQETDEGADGEGNNYGYDESVPYKIAFYLWDTISSDKIALYAAFPTLDIEPIPPVLAAEGEKPLPYLRRYDAASSSWEDPLPLVRPEVKVTQLSFILGGDNQDKVLITLELAREGPTQNEWRSYKLISAAKLQAR